MALQVLLSNSSSYPFTQLHTNPFLMFVQVCEHAPGGSHSLRSSHVTVSLERTSPDGQIHKAPWNKVAIKYGTLKNMSNMGQQTDTKQETYSRCLLTSIGAKTSLMLAFCKITSLTLVSTIGAVWLVVTKLCNIDATFSNSRTLPLS